PTADLAEQALQTFYDGGRVYQFSGDIGVPGDSGAGLTNTTAIRSKAGLMVASAFAMRNYCLSRDRSDLEKVTANIEALESRLPKDEGENERWNPTPTPPRSDGVE